MLLPKIPQVLDLNLSKFGGIFLLRQGSTNIVQLNSRNQYKLEFWGWVR